MKTYVHNVQYYETDKMGIVHHSNYIRWFEEARIDYLSQIGISFIDWENSGIGSAVVEVNCHYHHPMFFSDVASIHIFADSVEAAKLKVSYEVFNQNNTLCAKGSSIHCYTNKNGHPISLKRERPEDWNKLKAEENKLDYPT